MSWVEIIKVQTAGKSTDQKCMDYLTTLEQEAARPHGATIRLYRHAAFPEQHMVWIEWHSASHDMVQSRFSQVVVHELKQFGLVDHSAWSPEDRDLNR